jgi:hypothetical protein
MAGSVVASLMFGLPSAVRYHQAIAIVDIDYVLNSTSVGAEAG